MRTSIPNIMRAVDSAIWAIVPEKLEAIVEFLELRAAGIAFTAEELQARGITPGGRPGARNAGQVAVLPLHGVIGHHAGMEMMISGGTSTEAFGRAFDEAMNDSSIGAIVIDCDSPGGSVEGVPELAAKIFSARGKGKRIVAVANAHMNSAAYWVCSAADEIVGIPSSDAGSIGVFTMHTDISGAEAKAGVKRTVVAAGKYKGEAAPGVPLTDEAHEALQARVDACYELFAGDVAKHRGTSFAKVANGYGQGRSVDAKSAIAAGLIDRIATLDEVLAELSAGGDASGRRSMAAAVKLAPLAARRAAAALTERAALTNADGQLAAVATPQPRGGVARRTTIRGASAMAVCPECQAEIPEGAETCPECDADLSAAVNEDEEEEVPAARRGARAGQSRTRATHRPAHQARSHSMPDMDAAARRAVIQAETTRQNEIRTLCAENNVEASVLEGFLNAGTSVEAASAEILKLNRTRAASTPVVRNGSGLATNVRQRAEDDPRRGFTSHREYMLAVMANAGSRERSQVAEERLRPLAVFDKDDRQAGGELAFVLPQAFTPRSLQAAAGSDEQGGYADRFGGFSVPTQVMPGLLTTPFEGDPTAGLTQPVPMGAPMVEFNARTDKDHTSSVSGGFTVTRRPETAGGSSSRMQTEMVTLKASSLFGLAYATEEILTDSPISFAALIDSGFRDQFPAHILNEKIRGNGGTEFLGVLNSPAKVTVAKESGQTAATINATNILKMASRSWGFGQAIWLANHDTRPQLSAAHIQVGTAGGILLYQPSRGEGFPDMLWGRPVLYTEYASTLGAEGDLMLVNWSQYLEGTYQPLQSAESVHVRFVNHERAFKLWVRNAGAPWWRAALTPAKSTATLSPIVTLAVRA